jgi:hypothetical protein
MDDLVFVNEGQPLQRARGQMFRTGVRAWMVLRDEYIVGLVTQEAARAAARRSPLHGMRIRRRAGMAPKAGDLMVPIEQIPAIDWHLVERGQVCDLPALFEERGARHLLVVSPTASSCMTVRGLIHRDRIRQQLVEAWFDGWPSWCMRTGAMEY